ncbi:MAG: 1-acyl-sn-glycerol-3-phosphate acyltransferase [Anaerolineae bacterium]|nr:1-acyl-sn-glycerol-3-phosphate acyltransferase [Anaerolineae bacterium]
MRDIIPPSSPEGETISYRLPRRLMTGILWSVLAPRPRSFARDAQVALAGLQPAPEVLGRENVPVRGPILVACNHYSRPGFGAWWLALAISAAVAARRAPDADPEVRWVMTAAWTFPESRWKRRFLMPVTRWAFRHIARVYGFVPMPAMPPHPDEAAERARAVLETVRLARRGASIGLAPEGRDTAGLGDLPEGVGRFVAMLVGAGLPVLPTGVTETVGRLRISFGPAFIPQIPSGRGEQDRVVMQQVMSAIARQLDICD